MSNPFEKPPVLDNQIKAAEDKEEKEPSENEQEKSPIFEAVEKIKTVEDIAMARTMLEKKILSGEFTSEAECQAYYTEEVLKKFPAISKFGSFFGDVIQKVYETRNGIEAVFSYAEKNTANERERSEFLYHEAFEGSSEGGLKVTRDFLNIIYRLKNEDDIARAYQGSKDSVQSIDGFQMMTSMPEGHGFRRSVPVFVVRESATLDEDEQKKVIATNEHEKQHTINNLITQGRRLTLFRIERKNSRVFEESPEDLLDEIRKRENKSLNVENWIKDEILAFLKGYKTAYIPSDYIPSNKETLKDIIVILKDMVRPYFASPDEDYLKRYLERRAEDFNPGIEIKKQIEQATKSAKNGIDAFGELTEIYNLDMDMVNYVLDQFPLKQWPSVVRLIKMRQGKSKDRREKNGR